MRSGFCGVKRVEVSKIGLTFCYSEKFKCFVNSIVYGGLMPQVQKTRNFFKMLINRSEEARKHLETLIPLEE